MGWWSKVPTPSSNANETGWTLFQMEGLSWLNMAVGALLVGAAFLLDPPSWGFWMALVVGAHVVVLEAFDEWAEGHGMASAVVGPEFVILVGSGLLVGTVLVTGGSAPFVALAVVAGFVLAASAGLNLAASYRLSDEIGDERTR